MIDFHTHILPKIDDGSESLEMSLKMLDLSAANNVDTIIATPHFYLRNNTVSEFLKNRETAYNSLMELPNIDKSPKILRGAEVLLTADIPEIDGIEKLCIENTKYILIELPYTYWSEWVYIALYKLITEKNLIPIIAHMEQYTKILQDPNLVLRFLSMDVVIQMNAESIINPYSKNLALKMIQNNFVHVLGSDSHDNNRRPPNLKHAYKIIEKKLGDESLLRLNQNALDIISNKEIQLETPKKINKMFGFYY